MKNITKLPIIPWAHTREQPSNNTTYYTGVECKGKAGLVNLASTVNAKCAQKLSDIRSDSSKFSVRPNQYLSVRRLRVLKYNKNELNHILSLLLMTSMIIITMS